MDALDVLKEMHVSAKAGFQEIEKAPAEQRSQLWAKLKPELEIHEQIEENIVYGPASDDLQAIDTSVLQWEEHHQSEVEEAESLIEEIDNIDSQQGEWLNKITQLRSALEHHIEQEENQLWPLLRDKWGQDNLDRRRTAVEAGKAAASGGASVSGALEKATQALGG